MLPIIIIITSLASQYSPGTAQQVIENRQSGNAWASLPRVLPETDGYIAVQECGELGDIWWIQNPLTDVWESFLVIDCSMPAGTDGTIEWMKENDIAMEVDYETAVRWETVGGGVWVSWTKQNPSEYVEARNEKERWICEQ